MAKGTNKKKTKAAKRGRIGKTIRLLFSAFFLCLFVLGVLFLLKYGMKFMRLRSEAIALVNEFGDGVFVNKGTSEVYDKDGNIIAYLRGDKDTYYVTSDQIPDIVKDTFIVTEDRNFYNHQGIDIRGILRVFKILIKTKGEVLQGASTITQQLARNIYLSYEVSIERKVKEMLIAIELEEKYSKTQILEYYINNIYYANGYYGIEAAAKGYFNKSISELNDAELIFLCTIPNNPTLYDPYVNYNNIMKRMERIYAQMIEAGKLTDEDVDRLRDTVIMLNPKESVKHNYVETYVRYCATIELMRVRGFKFRNTFLNDVDKFEYTNEYNTEYAACNSLLFSGGLKIYTSIDMTKQEMLQRVLDEGFKGFIEKDADGIYKLQGSSVCIDNETGKVIAVVGGRSTDYPGYTLNRAFQSFRQPGSSIKPLIVYTPLFERGYMPTDIVEDVKDAGGPKNYNNIYSGKITLRKAVVDSKNTVAWNLFKELSPAVGLKYILNMDFAKIVGSDYNLGASIGGFTNGVSTEEMAGAFATIANGGVYREPTCIVKIEESNGRVLTNVDTQEKKVYDKNATLIMTDVLKDVVSAKIYKVDTAICAGKTGTTNESYDRWIVGYSKYFTLSVWCGYDYPKTMEGDAYNISAAIWQNFMNEVHEGLPKVDFEKYKANGNSSGDNSSIDGPGDSTSTTKPTSKPTSENEVPTKDSSNSGEIITDIYIPDIETGPYIPEDETGLYIP